MLGLKGNDSKEPVIGTQIEITWSSFPEKKNKNDPYLCKCALYST